MKNLVIGILASIMLSGCGMFSWIQEDPDTAQLAAQVAAWKYIERKEGVIPRSEEAEDVLAFAQNGLEALDSNESVLISQFTTKLSNLITTDNLSDRALAELLIGRIADRLNEWADRQGLDGDERVVAIRLVLQAVEEAAEMYIVE